MASHKLWGWHALIAPWLAWPLHAVALWIWHVLGLFEAALESAPVHALQYLSFLGSALLFWWALMQGRRGPRAYGAAVLYVLRPRLGAQQYPRRPPQLRSIFVVSSLHADHSPVGAHSP
jgi:hypothetical protein